MTIPFEIWFLFTSFIRVLTYHLQQASNNEFAQILQRGTYESSKRKKLKNQKL